MPRANRPTVGFNPLKQFNRFAPFKTFKADGVYQRFKTHNLLKIDLYGPQDFECASVIGDTPSQNRALYGHRKLAGASG